MLNLHTQLFLVLFKQSYEPKSFLSQPKSPGRPNHQRQLCGKTSPRNSYKSKSTPWEYSRYTRGAWKSTIRKEWTSMDQDNGPCEQSCTPRRVRHPVTCLCVMVRCTCWQGRSLTEECALGAANGERSGLLSRANSALESDVFTARIACARSVCVSAVTAKRCLRAARRWNGGPQWKKVARGENPIAWGTGAATHARGEYLMTTKSASRKSRDTLRSEKF